MKYKLIKTYPGSPTLGTIAEFEMTCNWSEFWKPAVEESLFSILSFKSDSGLTTLRANGRYVFEKFEPRDCPDGEGATLKQMLNHASFAAYQINRIVNLKNHKSFSLGDKIERKSVHEKRCGILTDIRLDKDDNVVYFTMLDENKKHNTCDSMDAFVPATSIYTSTEGHPIYIGDMVWWVEKDEKKRKKTISQTPFCEGHLATCVNLYYMFKSEAVAKAFCAPPKDVDKKEYSKKQVLDAFKEFSKFAGTCPLPDSYYLTFLK